jgi:hypothetical protein
LTASGYSRTGPKGPQALWIVTNLVPGMPLTKMDEYKAILVGPIGKCIEFLRMFYILLGRAAVNLETESGLFHMDLSDGI